MFPLLLCPYKSMQNSMLCFIHIHVFKNTCEVTMQVNRAQGKAISHKLPIYNEYMCLCWVPTLLARFVVCFPIVVKAVTFYLRCKCATFLCARTSRNVMKRSIEICLWKHLWIVFSLLYNSFELLPAMVMSPYEKRIFQVELKQQTINQ